MREGLYTYIHDDISQTALGDIVVDLASELYGELLYEILLTKDDDGVDNVTRLVEFYTEDELDENSEQSIRMFAQEQKDSDSTENDDQLKNLPLKWGTRLIVDVTLVSRSLIFTQSNQQVDQSSYNAFFNASHYRLLRSPLHRSIPDVKDTGRGISTNTFVHACVWIWPKSRNDNKIINVTPYIFSLSTEVNVNGGTFNMSLAPVQGEFKEGNWQQKEGTVKGDSDNLITHSNLHREGEKRSHYFFERALQQNDVVFIRFETLEIEKKSRNDLAGKEYVNPTDIPNQPYDMIGLIDSVNISNQAEPNDAAIQISGRDLSKLLIEDGVYFYPQLFATGGMFANITAKEKLKRYDGQLQSLFVFSFKNVATTLKFIMNALSNIAITPDSLFEPYKDSKDLDEKIRDRRSHFYSEKELTEALSYEKADVDVKRVISQIVLARDIRGLTNSTPNAIHQNLNSFVGHLINKGLFKTSSIAVGLPSGWGATEYDGQNLQADELPLFTKDTLMSKLPGSTKMILNLTLPTITTSDGIIFSDNDVLGIITLIRENLISVGTTSSFRPEPTSNPAKGIWQIIGLSIDESVQQRRLTDSSIGNEHGSLINAVKKVCQEPFVEFFTDTYYDKFFFVARKQPFDRNSMASILEGTTTIDTNIESIGNDYGPLIIDINEQDIYSENITYGDSAYSWYYLRPINMLNGGQNDMNFAYLKAVYLDRYAEIWGSKPFDIATNYVDYYSVTDKKLRNSVGRYIKQGIYDLKYVMDINTHLPFTRNGTISIEGDRRIKRGNFVRLVSSGEIFYVDSVSHNLSVGDSSIDRGTTLQLSRGMVEKHINPPSGPTTGPPTANQDTFSYFDIVNTEIPEGIFEQNAAGDPTLSANEYNEKILANWGVNDDVFDFFLKKKQFL